MTHCYQLTRKDGHQPSKLVDVDRELAEHLGLPCDDTNWVLNWENWLGFAFAGGLTPEQLLETPEEFAPEEVKLIEYIRDNYNVRSWREQGRAK